MNAGAKEIVPSMVGLIYTCSVGPALLVKLTGPYWFHLVTYKVRIVVCSFMIMLSFILVAVGEIYKLQSVQFVGVCVSSAQSGFGEASFLALSSFYNSPRTALTAWSSGTGMAGVFGYTWVIVFTTVFKLSFATTLFSANILAVAFWANYSYLLTAPAILREDAVDSKSDRFLDGHLDSITTDYTDYTTDAEDLQETTSYTAISDMTTLQRFWATLSLWPYMVPLFLVYYAEYAIQSGIWSAIGFPVSSKEARSAFYLYSNWIYQAGVLVSRSSGVYVKATMTHLWIMPVLQVGIFIFLLINAYIHIWYDNSILTLSFLVGLLGGAVYVQAFSLMSEQVPPYLKEFSLSAASIADSFGIALADISAIFIQAAIYRYLGINDKETR
jgi:battenin